MVNIAYCSSWVNGVCEIEGKLALAEESSAESLKRLIQRVNNVVLGSGTYAFLQEEKVDLSKARLVVYSDQMVADLPAGAIAATSPAEALAHFPNSGEQAILIAAESHLVEAFLALGLVNELIVDIEPGIVTAAQPLFANLSKKLKLEMIGMRKVGAATIQLHYKITR